MSCRVHLLEAPDASISFVLNHWQAFRAQGSSLAAGVEWILLHQDDPVISIPLSWREQLRVLTVGCNFHTAAVAQFFADVARERTERAPHTLEVLDAVKFMLEPSLAVVDSFCSILSNFEGDSADLAENEVWQEYLLVAGSMIGKVSSFVHEEGSDSSSSSAASPPDLDDAIMVLGRLYDPANISICPGLPCFCCLCLLTIDVVSLCYRCTAALDSVIASFSSSEHHVEARRAAVAAEEARIWASATPGRRTRLVLPISTGNSSRAIAILWIFLVPFKALSLTRLLFKTRPSLQGHFGPCPLDWSAPPRPAAPR